MFGQLVIVEWIGDGDQCCGGQCFCEQCLVVVLGGGDEKEWEDEEQVFLVDQLGCVVQQWCWDFLVEVVGEGFLQEVFED